MAPRCYEHVAEWNCRAQTNTIGAVLNKIRLTLLTLVALRQCQRAILGRTHVNCAW